MKIENLTVPVTVEVDLNAILASAQPEGYDYDNDEVILGGPLYRDLVTQTAAKLAETAKQKVCEEAAMLAQRNVGTQVGQIVRDTLDEGTVIGDGYRKTEVKPLRDLIRDEVQAWIARPQNTGYDRKGSPLVELIKKEVNQAMAVAMRDEIAKAKEDVREAVKKAAAEQIAKAVVR